jgi:membrane associated rhomboid family serine protease
MNEATVGHQCPECVAAGRRTQRSARTAFGGTHAGEHRHVTMVLIGLNVAVALVVLVIGGTQAAGGGGWGGLLGGITPAHVWGGMITGEPGVTIAYTDGSGGVLDTAAGVVNGDYYRLVTSMFLHYGIFHLLLNMYALWIVGGVLEPLLGRTRFLALYLVSGIGGGVATYLFGSVTTISAGASGAVFGLFGAFYILMRRLGRDTSMITMVLVVNLVLTFLVPNISIWGHLGGLVTGGLIALGLAYAPARNRTPVQAGTVAGLAVLLLALTMVRTLTLG